MPFETGIDARRAGPAGSEDGSSVAPRTTAPLPLRIADANAFSVAERRQGRNAPQQMQAHIVHLCDQIEALREQLRTHSADRMAVLLREMIDERERELERFLAREENWDRRLTAIEAAIVERDEARKRETALTRERDEARRAAEMANLKLEAAQRAAEAAHQEIAQAQRLADLATAEQLRLRSERDLDRRVWHTERRKLAEQIEQRDRGWIKRLIGG